MWECYDWLHVSNLELCLGHYKHSVNVYNLQHVKNEVEPLNFLKNSLNFNSMIEEAQKESNTLRKSTGNIHNSWTYYLGSGMGEHG